MYPAEINSPSTTLNGGINDSVTTIAVTDGSKLPAAPNLATIGTGEDAETILYTGNSGNSLTGVTRGLQGTAKAWDSGSVIARMFTAYDHDAFKTNIEALQGGIAGNLDNTPGGTNGLLTKASTSDVVYDINTIVNAHASRHNFGGADVLNLPALWLGQMPPFIYKPWFDTVGFTVAKDAEATITLNSAFLGAMYFQTGSTSGKKASVYADTGMYYAYASGSFNNIFHIRLGFWTVTDQTVWIGCFETPATPTGTQKHVGFTIENNTMYATNGDGTTQKKSSSLGTVAQYNTVDFMYLYGASNIKFYTNVNGAGYTLGATHTDNRPTTVYMKPLFYIINSAAADKQLYIHPMTARSGLI
jgi:hypothetical protein